MTNKRWIHETLAHSDAVPVPYHFSFTPLAKAALVEHYGVRNLEDALGLPIRTKSANSIKPSYADPSVYGETVTDEFGVVWATSKIDRGLPDYPQPARSGSHELPIP